MAEVPLPTASTVQTDVNLAEQTLNSVRIQESTPVEIQTSEGTLDVSGSTVTVDDNGNFAISNLPEPVDVSGATVTVTDDSTFAIDSLPEPVDVSGATLTVTDENFTISNIEDGNGNVISPATSDAQGNWPSGYDNTVAPSDTTVTALSAGPVPDGVTVAVQAGVNNSDPVAVGVSSSPAIQLSPGGVYSANVQDRSQIRVQLTTNGDVVNVSHEAN